VYSAQARVISCVHEERLRFKFSRIHSAILSENSLVNGQRIPRPPILYKLPHASCELSASLTSLGSDDASPLERRKIKSLPSL
jgi:hypothetical protein